MTPIATLQAELIEILDDYKDGAEFHTFLEGLKKHG